MPKKIDMNTAKVVTGSRYPEPYHEPCMNRLRHALGDAAGLTHFGVNLTRLSSGTWSSQRHWHSAEDEFIYIVEGELILITDSGEETLHAGDCAGFRAGDSNGHHLQNRSACDAVYLEIGSRRIQDDDVVYSDIDMRALRGRKGYVHRNGEPYPVADSSR